MFKCIRCPVAYHFSAENKKDKDDECVPAGSTLIAGCHIICPKHFNVSSDQLTYLINFFQRRKDKKSHKQIHVNNCFHCFEGGNLVICERCPAAYHDSCLEQPPATDGAWYCPDCSKGSTIHYNDIVWAKVCKRHDKLVLIFIRLAIIDGGRRKSVTRKIFQTTSTIFLTKLVNSQSNSSAPMTTTG